MRIPAASLFGLLLLLSAPLHAQTSAEVMTAREIAKEGIDAFDSGEYQRAADRLGEAYDIVKVPTIALYRARALVKLGRLVEASELYQEATTIEGDLGKQSKQQAAQDQAKKEREELLPRIPRLKVKIVGGSAKDVEVKVDGQAVAPQLLRAGYAVDAREHEVEGDLNGEVVRETFTVDEGDSATVTLSFKGTGTRAAPEGKKRSHGGDAAEDEAGEQRGGTQRTIGWIGIGTGAAALAVGSVAGMMSLGKKRDLDDGGCQGNDCFTDQKSDVDAHNRDILIANVGFAAGGVLAATGLTLLLTAPKRDQTEKDARHISPWIGIGQAGIRGRF